MADNRTLNVQRFREEQGASRVHILTAIAPFSVKQDRFVLMEWGEKDARAHLIVCTDGTPRAPLDRGDVHPVDGQTLRAFLRDIDDAAMAWVGDAIPPNVHDGVTITIERADVETYDRVRMVAPTPGSPHARLLAAWMDAFPETRRVKR